MNKDTYADIERDVHVLISSAITFGVQREQMKQVEVVFTERQNLLEAKLKDLLQGSDD